MGWLVGWAKRKIASITAGSGAGANYQMRVHVLYGSGSDSGEDVYLDGACKADFSDLRFTSSDGVSLLGYWLQSKTDSDNAVFWVKVAADLDSDQTICVYFGNSTVASLSSQASTFIDVIGGVVGAWAMDELSGQTVTDYSGNANHGTMSTPNNGTITGATRVTGKYGNGLRFDGNDYVDLGAGKFESFIDGSLSIWFKATSYEWKWFFSHQADDGTNRVDILVRPDSSTVYACIVSGGVEKGVSTAISLDIWHHCVLTFGAAGLKLYIDNSLVSQDLTCIWGLGTITSSLVNVFGADGNHANPFTGDLDEARIYNRALTTDEITALYNNSRVDSGLVGEWLFEEASGATAFDTHQIVDSPFYVGKKARQILGTSLITVADANNLKAINLGACTFISLFQVHSKIASGQQNLLIKGAEYLLSTSGSWSDSSQRKNYDGADWDAGGTARYDTVSINTSYYCVATFGGVGQALHVYLNNVDGGTHDNWSGTLQSTSNPLIIGGGWNGAGASLTIGFTAMVSGVLTLAQRTNLQGNYLDSTLLAGSVLVRKWATTTQPTFNTWATEETAGNTGEHYYYYLESTLYGNPAAPTPKHKYDNSVESDEAARLWRLAQEKRRRLDHLLTEVAKDRIREDNRRMNRSVRNRNFGE